MSSILEAFEKANKQINTNKQESAEDIQLDNNFDPFLSANLDAVIPAVFDNLLNRGDKYSSLKEVIEDSIIDENYREVVQDSIHLLLRGGLGCSQATLDDLYSKEAEIQKVSLDSLIENVSIVCDEIGAESATSLYGKLLEEVVEDEILLDEITNKDDTDDTEETLTDEQSEALSTIAKATGVNLDDDSLLDSINDVTLDWAFSQTQPKRTPLFKEKLKARGLIVKKGKHHGKSGWWVYPRELLLKRNILIKDIIKLKEMPLDLKPKEQKKPIPKTRVKAAIEHWRKNAEHLKQIRVKAHTPTAKRWFKESSKGDKPSSIPTRSANI